MPRNPPLTDAQKMWGKTVVTVSGEPRLPVSVSLQPARSISGVVVFDAKQRPDPTARPWKVRLVTAPAPQEIYFAEEQLQATVGPDGRFTITGVRADDTGSRSRVARI
jgi:hypothetical protein